MNMIDALIILGILFCGAMGFKKGFTKELVSFLGFFLVVVLAFVLKNPISKILYQNLPFFTFGGVLKGVTALNIIVYEVLAFFIVVFLLTFVWKILLFATSIFEKLLNMTIILGIPSKILGMIVGIVEGFVWAFILLYIFTLPIFHIDEMQNAKLAAPILKNTPILSEFTKDFKRALDEFAELKEDYKEKGNAEEFNYNTLEILLKYNIIEVDAAKELEKKGKLKINNIDTLLNQYQEEN